MHKDKVKNKKDAVMLVDRFIEEHKLLSVGGLDDSGGNPVTVIVGLSGGPDSVFLLHALCQLRSKYKIVIVAAHLDHGWRENSSNDALFCKNLAHDLSVEFVSAHASEIKVAECKKDSGSREDCGRQLRRAFFAECMHKYNASAIALAHHQDDQLETFMVRLIRGTGVTGLACMRPRSDAYIRPLLAFTKAEILAYLEEKSIAYVLDRTNFTDEHLRNRIRKYVLPAFKLSDERFENSCLRTIKNMQEHEAFLERLTRKTLESLTCGFLPEESHKLNLAEFRALDPFMQKRVLMHVLCREKVAFTPSEKFFDEMLRFLCNPTGGRHLLHLSWAIEKKRNYFWIVKK